MRKSAGFLCVCAKKRESIRRFDNVTRGHARQAVAKPANPDKMTLPFGLAFSFTVSNRWQCTFFS